MGGCKGSLEERLHRRLLIPEDPAACWEWQGCRNSTGYGAIWSGDTTRGPIGVHVAAWELAYGPVPEGKQVLHRCDNRLCGRHDHLFLGTQAENIRDAIDKGRWVPYFHPKGSASHRSKLTAQQREDLVRRRLAGESLGTLVAEFGVCRHTIWLQTKLFQTTREALQFGRQQRMVCQ